MIFITAFVTMRMGRKRLLKSASLYLLKKVGPSDTDTLHKKFDEVEGYGPTSVRKFVEETKLLGERTPEQWQQDAFGQVDLWLRALNLRS